LRTNLHEFEKKSASLTRKGNQTVAEPL